MDDLISRQEALDAMDTWDKFGCNPDGRLARFDDNKHYVPYVRYDDMVYAIKSLPSAQPERKNESVGCNGCRYDWFGDPRCNRCARSFQDRYEAEMRGEQNE